MENDVALKRQSSTGYLDTFASFVISKICKRPCSFQGILRDFQNKSFIHSEKQLFESI